MDNTLDYQSRDRKIDPRFSSLSDETLNFKTEVPSPYNLVFGGTFNPSLLTHSYFGMSVFEIERANLI